MGMLFYILSAEVLAIVFLYFRYLPHFLKLPLDSLPVWPHRCVPLPGRGNILVLIVFWLLHCSILGAHFICLFFPP